MARLRRFKGWRPVECFTFLSLNGFAVYMPAAFQGLAPVSRFAVSGSKFKGSKADARFWVSRLMPVFKFLVQGVQKFKGFKSSKFKRFKVQEVQGIDIASFIGYHR